MQTRIIVLKEVTRDLGDEYREKLCLQQVVFDYGNGVSHIGFRFIRRDRDGKLKPQRGQAGIPNLEMISSMVAEMEKIQIQNL